MLQKGITVGLKSYHNRKTKDEETLSYTKDDFDADDEIINNNEAYNDDENCNKKEERVEILRKFIMIVTTSTNKRVS